MIKINYSLFTCDDSREVVLRGFDIGADHLHLAVRTACSHHDVGAVRELIYVAGEKFVLDNHRFEVVVGFDARQLKLLDDVGDLFESMVVCVTHGVEVGNYEKS